MPSFRYGARTLALVSAATAPCCNYFPRAKSEGAHRLSLVLFRSKLRAALLLMRLGEYSLRTRRSRTFFLTFKNQKEAAMNRTQTALALSLSSIFFAIGFGVAVGHAQQPAQGGLKTVDNPGGGQFVYGSLTNQLSQSDAMVFMLRQVHGHFGDRPQVGKLFQSRDGSSLATFFTLTAKTQGNKSMAGLVIVSMPKGSTPQAAVLYDDVKRFATTEPSMMKTLGALLQPDGAMHNSAAQGRRGSAAPTPPSTGEQLFPATAGDNSAVISLPAGWKVTGVSGGQLTAEGSHGEMVGLGLLYQGIFDPRNPQS